MTLATRIAVMDAGKFVQIPVRPAKSTVSGQPFYRQFFGQINLRRHGGGKR